MGLLVTLLSRKWFGLEWHEGINVYIHHVIKNHKRIPPASWRSQLVLVLYNMQAVLILFFFLLLFSLLFSCLHLWERIHFKSEWKWTMWQPRLFRVASEDYHIVKLILALSMFGMHRPPPPCQSCHCQRESRVALSGGRGSSAKGAVYESGTDSQRSSCKIPVNRQMIALLPLQVIRPWSSPFVSRLWFPLLIAHL